MYLIALLRTDTVDCRDRRIIFCCTIGDDNNNTLSTAGDEPFQYLVPIKGTFTISRPLFRSKQKHFLFSTFFLLGQFHYVCIVHC